MAMMVSYITMKKKLLVFRPAVDSTFILKKMYKSTKIKKSNAFYAQPGIAERNLFDAGLEAFIEPIGKDTFKRGLGSLFYRWKYFDIQFETGFEIKCIKWMNFEKYRETIRKNGFVLSLMLFHILVTFLWACACGICCCHKYLFNQDKGLSFVYIWKYCSGAAYIKWNKRWFGAGVV